MLNRIYLLLLILIFPNNITLSQNFVAGYYPDWLKSVLPPQNIKFENLTHIIHAFAWPQSNGEIQMYSGMLNPNLNNAVHNAGEKILLAFGGWGNSSGFAPMVADSISRTNFIDNVLELLQQNEYDGVDFDWEFPANITEGKGLTKLVSEMRQKFNQVDSSLLITMAVSSGSYSGQNFEYEKMYVNINFFSMMGYDFHGSWTGHAGHNAPLYQPSNCSDGCSDLGIRYLTINRKIPKEKLLLGVPFYGKEFYASGLYMPKTGTVTDLTYTNIAPRLSNPSWEYYWDSFSKVPYLQNTVKTRLVTFDDTVSIRYKCEYVVNNQLKGIMIWALGQDIYANSQPLLATIGKEMGLVTSISEFKDEVVSDYQLYNNFPNPFNPSTKIRFSIPQNSFIKLVVYDVFGQEVEVLIEKNMATGSYEVTFNASKLSSGFYIYSLISGNYVNSKKMLLVK